MNIIARKAMRTTVAIAPNWICWAVQGSHGSVLFISSGAATVPTYAAETIMHARQIVVPIVWSLFMFFTLFSLFGGRKYKGCEFLLSSFVSVSCF